MYISMALLLLSSIPNMGLFGDAVKLIWLVSVALLAVLNLGAACGVYVASVAMFAVLRSSGGGSIVERPDNYAFLLVAGGLTLSILGRRVTLWWNWSTLAIVGLLAYVLLQMIWMGLLSRLAFASFMRMFGIPMVLFVLLVEYRFTLHEFRAFVRALVVLGAYMALVSIAEHFGWYSVILPRWIADPSLSVLDKSRNWADLTGRAGGLLLQSEFNALALSMIACVAILFTRVFEHGKLWLGRTVCLLSLVGIFFTGTRAAWLAIVPGALVLLWRPSTTRTNTYLRRLGLIAASTILLLSAALLPSSFARERIAEPDAVGVRLQLWTAALRMIATRPMLGRGFNMFAVNVEDYQEAVTAGHRMAVGRQMELKGYPAHNTTLSVLAELGAIGLVLYASTMVIVARRAMTGARQSWGREGVIWVVVFLVVYLLQTQFVVAYEPTTNQVFFGMMGATAGLRPRGLVGRVSR